MPKSHSCIAVGQNIHREDTIELRHCRSGPVSTNQCQTTQQTFMFGTKFYPRNVS